MYILSSKTLREINESTNKGLLDLIVSLDLGLSKQKITLSKTGFYVGDEFIENIKVREDDKSCYIIREYKLEKLQFIDHESGGFYKLVPTEFRPILQVSGTSMHKKSFLDKLERDKLYGKILDSGTGLGYSSIVLSKTADKVITVEIDKNVVEIAKINPYSQELFRNRNIKLILGDITQEIKKFINSEFDFIIFDAGTVKGSEGFFSLNNYIEAFRVLKPRGRLYHYLPKHHIHRGRDFASEVISRIKKVGFKKIIRNKEDSYIICIK